MEPERKIEKWLRAYAKKRRGQAKESFDLHPAARRLLQDEIARKAPTLEESDDSLSLWDVLRQRWALLLAFAACIFLAGIIFLPALNTAKEKAQPSLSMANFKPTSPAVQMAAEQNNEPSSEALDELTNGYLAKGELNDAELADRKKFAEATNQDLSQAVAMNNLSSRQPESPAPAEREMAIAPNVPPPGPASPLAAPASASPAPTAASEPNSLSESPPMEVPAQAANPISAGPEQPTQPATVSTDLAFNTAGSTPAVMAPSSVTVGGAFAASAVRREAGSPPAGNAAQYQFESGLQNAYQNNIAPSQAMPVLSNFQVQQNGNALRIVDRDGSVYVGSWQPANVATANGIVDQRAMQNSDELSVAKMPQTSAPPAMALGDIPQVAQNYFFRVHGMNRTLNQGVVFTGSLLANFALSANMQQGFGGGGGGANISERQVKAGLTNQVAQLPWSNLRFAGMAIINRTNHIEVNATPVVAAKQN